MADLGHLFGPSFLSGGSAADEELNAAIDLLGDGTEDVTVPSPPSNLLPVLTPPPVMTATWAPPVVLAAAVASPTTDAVPVHVHHAELSDPSSTPKLGSTKDTAPSLKFWFLDVGQGNATWVECPGGETMLIDLGCVSRSFEGFTVHPRDVVKENVKKFLARHVPWKMVDSASKQVIDYLIISHPDEDHINLIPEVLAGFTILRIYGGAQRSLYPKNLELWPIMMINGGKPHSESPADAPGLIVTGGGLQVRVVSVNAPLCSGAPQLAGLWPEGRVDDDTAAVLEETLDAWAEQEKDRAENYGGRGTHKNTSSIVLSFRYGSPVQQVLICADATFSTDFYILTQTAWRPEVTPGALKSYALSGGHHGSRKSYSPTFLQNVDPRWLHFGAEFREDYAHPEWALVSRILRFCPNIGQEYGPHGVILGGRQLGGKKAAESLQDYIATGTIPMLMKMREELQEMSWPKLLALIVVRSYLDPKGVGIPDEDWAHRVFREGHKYCTQVMQMIPDDHPFFKDRKPYFDAFLGQVFVEWQNGRPAELNYWGGRFKAFSDELTVVKKMKFSASSGGGKSAVWEWFVTDYDIFTTMESSQMGVYWFLEIPAEGEPIADRT